MKSSRGKTLLVVGLSAFGLLMLFLSISTSGTNCETLRFIFGFFAYGILFPIMVVYLVVWLEKLGKRKNDKNSDQ